jgi:hypothetical protein
MQLLVPLCHIVCHHARGRGFWTSGESRWAHACGWRLISLLLAAGLVTAYRGRGGDGAGEWGAMTAVFSEESVTRRRGCYRYLA